MAHNEWKELGWDVVPRARLSTIRVELDGELMGVYQGSRAQPVPSF